MIVGTRNVNLNKKNIHIHFHPDTQSVVLAFDGKKSGTIKSTLAAGGYSYFYIQDADSSYWIAVTQLNAREGDQIIFTGQMWMKDFQSRKLGMTFPSILFAGNASVVTTHQSSEQVINPVVTQRSEGQISILELKRDATSLAGTRVIIGGQAIKVMPNIMGKTWIHLKDGDTDSSKIVITTNATNISVGSAVTVTGVVSVDKDFGMGYFYPVIIEDAEVYN